MARKWSCLRSNIDKSSRTRRLTKHCAGDGIAARRWRRSNDGFGGKQAAASIHVADSPENRNCSLKVPVGDGGLVEAVDWSSCSPVSRGGLCAIVDQSAISRGSGCHLAVENVHCDSATPFVVSACGGIEADACEIGVKSVAPTGVN